MAKRRDSNIFEKMGFSSEPFFGDTGDEDGEDGARAATALLFCLYGTYGDAWLAFAADYYGEWHFEA